MFSALAVFFFGIAILLAAAEVLVRAAVKLSAKFKISPLVVGTTIVAIGTSLPEAAVSLTAATFGDSGLAIGNLIGSNIINIFLILGLAILAGGMRVGTTKTPRNAIILLSTAVIFYLLFLRPLSPASGIILLALAAGFTWLEYQWARRGRAHEDKKYFIHVRTVSHQRLAIELTVSLIALILGGIITVAAAENLAKTTGISTTIIGMSLMALATSLPELFVSVVSEFQKQPKLALGNVIGSNIYNLLLIGGTVVFFSPENTTLPSHWLFLFAASAAIVALVFGFKGRVVPRWVGGLMLAVLAVYFWSLVKNS